MMMSETILQINFKFHVSRTEYEAAVTPLAEPVAATPGLLWKVWLMNEAEQEAGGIYLFTDSQSVGSFLNSDLVAGIVSHPALSDFSVKQFEALESLCAITRAPLAEAVAP
jgi:small neutral amino acid transporter SnatA (MarC family)